MKHPETNKSQVWTGNFAYATIGSRTQRGGEVVTGREGHYIGEFKVACVGDRVRYPDGSESLIVSGAGCGSVIGDVPVALVESHVANGDRIASSPQDSVEIVLADGDEPITGFLEPGFLPVSQEGHA